MNNSVTIQDLRSAKESIEIESDQISYDLGKMRTENVKLQVDLLNAKQRLLRYENEAGIPKSASEREAYMSYNPK